MNHRQRFILIVSAVLIALMLIYPAFQFMGRGMGYSWIFLPPNDAAIVNNGQLLVQWIAVALIGGISFLLSKDGAPSGSLDGTKKKSAIAIPDGAFTAIFLTLRIIRGIAGFFGLGLIIPLARVLFLLLPLLFDRISNPDAFSGIGEIDVPALMLLVAALICSAMFFGLRSVINKLHIRRHGVQHPALLKEWNL